MRYPEFLKPGGTIGFIAPSFGVATEPYITSFNKAIEIFQGMGYRTVEGPNARASVGIGKSNTPKACGAEINDFFINNRSDVIVSCGGGELMCEDLPFVDFEKISKSIPKWYMGYSDNTNLTFLLPTLTDTAAIYGICGPSFGMDPWHKAVEDAYLMLAGCKLDVNNYDGWESERAKCEEHPLAPYGINQPYKQIVAGNVSKASNFSGRLLGGCMDCLVTLCGTRFDKVKEFNARYAKDGVIWFLEACDLNVMGMRRALWQLENAGWFENVKGFLIGRPVNYNDSFDGFTPHDAVTGILEKYNVPIIMDLDIGHMAPMMPLISGANATVCAKENSIRISMKLT